MNESNNKKILFNKSTLLSLKAELLKKQEEVNDKKRLPQHKIENYKPPPAQKKEKSSDHRSFEKKSFKDSLKYVDTEELEALKKSKAALEKKAELYEHLSDSIGTSHLTNQFLVDFNNKKQEEIKSEEKSLEDTFCVDDSEWTEYVDCLGRSRKCLKSDLELYKKRDEVLSKSISKDTNDKSEGDTQEAVPEVLPAESELMKATNDYLQSLREKWEQKENELLTKKGDIHYQDVLFDEARVHGVGYFAFSTDEAVRKKQMEDLIKTREETVQAQKEAEAARKKRNELIAARAAAARARQRLRAGLPPEDPEEKKVNFEAILLEFLTQQRDAVENEAKEKERKEKEEKEKERDKLRKEYVRQWDLGKEGVGGETIKKFRQMSQEEYVEQQRAKRIKEFAPQKDENHRSELLFNSKGELSSDKPKTWAQVRPLVNNVTVVEQNEPKGLYFSSKATKYGNFVQGATLIVNELDEERSDKERRNERSSARAEMPPPPPPIINDYNHTSKNTKWKTPEMEERVLKRKTDHAEIPPPLTFDYNCASTNTHKSQKPFYSDLQEAYAQGLKQLEKKKSKRNICEKYTFIS